VQAHGCAVNATVVALQRGSRRFAGISIPGRSGNEIASFGAGPAAAAHALPSWGQPRGSQDQQWAQGCTSHYHESPASSQGGTQRSRTPRGLPPKGDEKEFIHGIDGGLAQGPRAL